MDLATRLMHALTDPDFTLDDEDSHPDLSQVSDEALGSLLAADTEITDESILMQIKRGA